MIVRDVGDGIAIDPFRLLQLRQNPLHVGKFGAVLCDETPQPVETAAIELDQGAPAQALEDQLHVARTHGQKRQQRQSGPEIDSNQSLREFLLRTLPLQAVGLALAR